jgi:NAD(P) transhydrogenase subunit alpha
MKIAVPKEVLAGERRVAATPDTVGRLRKLGFEVAIEAGAGEGASFPDELYRKAGAEVVADTRALWTAGDIVLKVQPPLPHPSLGVHEVELARRGAFLVSFLWPARSGELIERLKAAGVDAFAMDAVPRISRAQKLDALSSMANIAGYRAIVEAASRFGRFFTGQMTAAGKVAPAKVLVIGAGVAGLAAIGAARSLGAIVRAFDTRAAVKDQVKSMGAEFIELDVAEEGEGHGGYAKEMSPAFIAAEMAMFAAQARDVDVIVTTALIPNKRAPVLITEEMVKSMKPGSVIVDLAAENGGNCEVTVPGEAVVRHGVHVVGFTDLPSRMAPTASQLYGNNLANLLADMGGAAKFAIDLEDEVVRGGIVVKDSELLWPPPRKEAPPQAAPRPASTLATHAAGKPVVAEKKGGGPWMSLTLAILAVLLAWFGTVAPASFLQHLTVFALACVVGWQVVWNVTPALHTPLMSVTNAISGIIVIGGMLQVSGDPASPVVLLGAAAILLAAINIAGGFLVTQRMLRMFHR